jgi:hypothetical protein
MGILLFPKLLIPGQLEEMFMPLSAIFFGMQSPCKSDRRYPNGILSLKVSSRQSQKRLNGKNSFFKTIILTRSNMFMPRVIYFSECHLLVGLTAGLQIECRAQKFPLSHLKNVRMGTLLFPKHLLPRARCVCP